MNRIKEVLDEKGIKQTWLAEQLGKNYNMVNAYVQNRQQPRIELLYEIAEILGVNVKELLIDNEIKKDKKMSNEQKITTDIKAPNKDMEILRSHFPHCFDKDGKFDFAKFKSQLDAQNVELTFEKESYGLDWLGKSYARLLASDPATTLLKANETHNAKPENAKSENLLIKGDNLEVLKHLANAYYEKIKMIYIDPPYNTGSDGFVYNDDRKYTVKELQNLIGIDEEKAKRILEFAQSKSNSHSAWLTFMYPRLYIARQLLREDGVIFVSIDDNEVAQLRLLMDEIFGEENFVVQFIRKSVSNRAMAKYSNTQHEYVIAFAKNLTYLELSGDYKDLSAYQNPDNDPNGEWVVSNPSRVGGYVYGIKNPYTGKVEYPPKGRGWVFKEKDLEELINQGKLVFLKEYKENQRGFILKGYLKDLKSERKLINSLDLSVNFYMNQVGTKELIDLMGDNYFSFPKPVSLVKYFANIIQDDNAIILDFFAGSGTTGDAVMQLNAEDGGNRKYILVQLPEPIDPKKNKTAYDFVKDELKAEPTIFEICKERLIRAAKKIKEETIDKKITEKEKELQNLQSELNLEDRDEKIKSLEKEIENLQKQDLGFKIFETMPIWEDYNFEAEEFNPQQELFDTSKLTEDDIKALLVTWKTYDGIALTQELESIDLSGYTAYYGNGRLYLMHKGFTTNNLKALLEKIDSDKHFEPKSIIVFGYNMESKSLREISENVKTYNNKKKSDIDFITRY